MSKLRNLLAGIACLTVLMLSVSARADYPVEFEGSLYG